jgi:hypothetical protein
MSNWVDGLHIGIMTNGRFSIEDQFPDATYPPDVDISHFYGQVVDPHGEPAAGVVVRFNIACPPKFYDGSTSIMAITTEYVDATTNESGIFEIDLLKDVPYRVLIDDAGLFMAFTVPDGANVVNLFELLSP